MIVDFHSHILPGIDDGSGSMEESVEMLRAMKQQGISGVVATPHFYASHDYPEKFLKRRQEAFERLRDAICDEELPQVYTGAEVAYFHGMSRSDALEDLVIAGTRAVMVEMPVGTWTQSMYDELERIHTVRGLVPVVAHVDRYLSPLRSLGIADNQARLPVLVQANANFFLRKNTARKALGMLRKEQIHLLGSDCHNMSQRPPNLGAAVEIIKNNLNEEALLKIQGWQTEVLNRNV